MRKFTAHITLFLLTLLIAFVGISVLGHYREMRHNSADKIYVWGDSQMFQGLDLGMFEDVTKQSIVSAAGHGFGIYDFLFSVQRIPCGSTVIVAFPECALLRAPDRDYNGSGFEPRAVFDLYKAGFSLPYCLNIVHKNRIQILRKAVFVHEYGKYQYADSIAYAEPLSGFCNMFNTASEACEHKCLAYERGIQHLMDKQCRLVIVQFPFYHEVEQCVSESVNRHLTDSLKAAIIGHYALQSDTIVLRSDSTLMHDLSHLNGVGQRLSTQAIIDATEESDGNLFLTIVL